MRRFASLFIMMAIALTTMAQSKLTPDAKLRLARMKAKVERQARIKGQAQETQRIMLVVTVSANDKAGTVEQMKAAGAQICSHLGNQVIVSIPVDRVEALQQIEGVQRIDKGHKGRLKTDVTRNETGVSLLNGSTLPANTTAYTGKGVTICVIDAGFDYQHPAFKDAEGRSRIKCVYRINGEGGHKYTVDDPEIGSYTFPGCVYDTPELIATLTTDDEEESHGTHTAGIAAGSLSPMGFGGMAPEADLVLVSLEENFSEEFEDLDIDDYVELALAFVANYAKQSDQPVVLSFSGNSHMGPHDGTSTVAQAIEAASNSVIPVVSAGNEGGYPIHLYHKFDAAKPSVKTILIAMLEDEDGEYEFIAVPEVFGLTRAGDEISVQLSLTSINPFTGRLSNIWTSEKVTATPGCEDQVSIMSSDEDETLAKYFDGDVAVAAMEQEDGRLLVHATAQGGLKNMYLWVLNVSGSEGTEIDLWDDLAGFAGQDYIGIPGYTDGDSEMSGGDWTTTEQVISVGAYCANIQMRDYDGSVIDTSKGNDEENDILNDLAWFSSYGTYFNGVSQPVVCAPGVNVVSSMNHYYLEGETFADGMQWEGYPYAAESGTSMSCPVVSGIVALWLQANPDMTLTDVKNVLSHTSRSDSFTNADTKNRWGYGKIDAEAGINYILNNTESVRGITDFVPTPDNVVYDLQGRRVNHRPTAGLYIINGKKVVVR